MKTTSFFDILFVLLSIIGTVSSFSPTRRSFDNIARTHGKKYAAAAAGVYDDEIRAAKAVLVSAAEAKSEDPKSVVESLLSLEKNMRAKSKVDGGITSTETLANLNGSWRLIFTTGTIDVQKKTGRINYFPLKAVQSFDTKLMQISNAIYIADFALIKFFGNFEWKDAARKVE